jgi:hypothetical protein
MTDTANLGLPFIEGSQAQKHVTHNEGLRILDAAIQIAVLDLTRTSPPSSPAEGERHVVASGATGAWAGHVNAIATWQDGAWAFLAARAGWCIWSVADDVMFVFDGTHWRDLRDLPVTLDNAVHVGINTSASAPNLLSVKSNAALFTAINVADGGSGDVRLQISKESAAKTASVFFSDAFSGRAEFGLVGSDAFKLKVSADGSAWVEAFTIDQSTGNLALPRGLALTGVIAPPQITSNQNNYNPTGVATAAVLQLSSDASRSITGLAGGAEGRVIGIINVGSQPIVLSDESGSSTAANRFTLGVNLTIAAKQAALLRYDGTAARWQAISSAAGLLAAANNLSDLASPAGARANLGVRDVLSANRTYYVRGDGNDGNSGLANTSGGAFLTVQKAIDSVAALDIGVYAVTIQIADGSYAGANVLKNVVGFAAAGNLVIKGNTATPANVVISASSAIAFSANGITAVWDIKDLKITTTTSGSGIAAQGGSTIRFGNLDFGAVAGAQLFADSGAQLVALSGYSISGGASYHWQSINGAGIIVNNGLTVTLTGTPAFTAYFTYAGNLGLINCYGLTFSGSATGSRYNVFANSAVFTNGAGATYLPGNAAGTTASGGQYV